LDSPDVDVVVDGDGDGDEITDIARSASRRPEPGGLSAADAAAPGRCRSVAVAVAVNHHVNEGISLSKAEQVVPGGYDSAW
jgi:hypothetical protein